jgi:hypothetical protein
VKNLCFVGEGLLWKNDKEGHVDILGVELTCFREMFRLKISKRHCVATTERSRF